MYIILLLYYFTSLCDNASLLLPQAIKFGAYMQSVQTGLTDFLCHCITKTSSSSAAYF